MMFNNLGRINSKYAIFALLVILLLPVDVTAQQVADLEFRFDNKAPAYEDNNGPRLLIDRAHSPYIQRGSFDPFLRLVDDDGFQAGYLDTKITRTTLDNVQILVIANAFRKDYYQFALMQPPSAYEPEEITIIRNWVTNGGRLLLIADHAPFAGGTSALAEAFGFTFFNAYVFDDREHSRGNGEISYSKSNGLNTKHSIVRGSSVDGEFDKFVIFTGSAFIAPAGAKALLTLPEGYIALMTQALRREAKSAARINVSGLSQGATIEPGEGRMAVFAEAGSFTAQIINGKKRFGMNVARAKQNPLFVLATMRWLAQGL